MNNMILATSQFCGPCKMIKARLDEMGISYECKDMMTDRDFFVENQIRSVPVLITSEAEKISGFDQILAYFQKNS